MHKESLPDDPGGEVRTVATERALLAAGVPLEALAKRGELPEPLEHIFSHVRHTMHVEHGLATTRDRAGGGAEDGGGEGGVGGEGEVGGEEVWTRGGRMYSWMSEQRMREVGVTAGVLKVIAAVSSAIGAGAAPGKPGGARGKCKAPASDSAQQPKLSAFFGKK